MADGVSFYQSFDDFQAVTRDFPGVVNVFFEVEGHGGVALKIMRSQIPAMRATFPAFKAQIKGICGLGTDLEADQVLDETIESFVITYIKNGQWRQKEFKSPVLHGITYHCDRSLVGEVPWDQVTMIHRFATVDEAGSHYSLSGKLRLVAGPYREFLTMGVKQVAGFDGIVDGQSSQTKINRIH